MWDSNRENLTFPNLNSQAKRRRIQRGNAEVKLWPVPSALSGKNRPFLQIDNIYNIGRTKTSSKDIRYQHPKTVRFGCSIGKINCALRFLAIILPAHNF